MGLRRVINWYNTDAIAPSTPGYWFYVPFAEGVLGQLAFPDQGINAIPQITATFDPAGLDADGCVRPITSSTDPLRYGRDIIDPALPWYHTEDLTIEVVSRITGTTIGGGPNSSFMYFNVYGFKAILQDYYSPNQKAFLLETPAGGVSSAVTANDQWINTVGIPIPVGDARHKITLQYVAATGVTTVYLGTAAILSATQSFNSSHNQTGAGVAFDFGEAVDLPGIFRTAAIRVIKGLPAITGDINGI